MIRKLATAFLFALALPAAAQVVPVVPAANYTDIWYNADESGWGVTFTQHAANTVEAVWYTYDPRAPDPASPGTFKPLWLVMPGGTWTSPTSITGDVYVTLGTPFSQNWNPAAFGASKIGTFTFNFASPSAATFTYNISVPPGLASTDPAFGLPLFSGSKAITRQLF
ncbi:MAG: hypothetical protein ACXWG6_02035 [Usitatibacter sp.]